MTSNTVSKVQTRGFDPREIYKNSDGFKFGEADLLIGGNTKKIIGGMAAYLVLAVKNNDDQTPFKGLTVIAPPKLVWDYSDKEILQFLLEGIQSFRTEAASHKETEMFQRMLTVYRCQLLDVSQVIDGVNAAGQNQLICIIGAAKYRDHSIPALEKPGFSAVVIAEDQWIPHLVSLASNSLNIAKASDSYLIIETPEMPPVRESNVKLLVDIDGLYPVLIGNEFEPNDLVVKNSEKWVGMVLTGRIEEALKELESVDIHQTFKSQLAIQLIWRTGNYELTAQRIRDELQKGTKFPADIAIRFGRMAERGDEVAVAQTLFFESIPLVADRQLLEGALASVTSLANADLIDMAFERLDALFPDSELLNENRQLRLMQYCQIAADYDQIDSSKSGFTDSNLFLVNSLCGKADINYEDLLGTFTRKWPEEIGLATICCALNAQANKQYVETIRLAISANYEPFERQSTRLILHAVRRMMLINEVPHEEINFYKLPLRFVIDYLSRNPDDSSTRSTLARVLSVEACGALGLPIIASLALDISHEGELISAKHVLEIPDVSEDEFKNFFIRAIQWMGKAPFLELGVTYLPKELVGDNPLGLIDYIVILIRHSVNRPKEDVDMDFLENCVHVLCLLGIYASEDVSDIDVLRLFADRLWLEGRSQKARDIAEQILVMAGTKPQRHRMAWASFADIYHRTRDQIEALIGISCAIACKAKVDAAELCQETQTLLRITRDLGLNSVAKGLISKCRELYAMQGLATEGNLRINTIELGLRLGDVRNENNTGLEQLLIDITLHCQEVLEQNDELLPIAVLLAQAVELCRSSGFPVSKNSLSLLDIALQRIGPRLENYFRAVSTTNPTAEDLINLHQRQEVAKNSEDIAGDFAVVVMAARRLLKGDSIDSAPDTATLAIELLAERSIDQPQGETKLTVEWPADYASKLSTEGVNIALLGLSEKGDLIAVIAKNGNLEVRHSSQTKDNFLNRLKKWSLEYPYRYGWIDRGEGNNEFYVSMASLDIPLPDGTALLVIAEPTLQQIPMNLILHTDDFIGKKIPIGIVPSLTWLEAVMRIPAKHDGRRLAWISASDIPEEANTLETVLSRLQPTLDEFGFQTDTSRHIPKSLGGAQMVVVAAHGGLTTEERFIHKISDEGSLVESPLLLAQSLQNVEVVILFVCSGGRLDKHPLVNTAVGLPKLLLDRGCRAVIASPWPLSPLVTYHWLEGFMRSLEAGDTVLSATFQGNLAVQEALGDPPQYGLAMIAYGNVLLKNS